jgi:hypothetical protein
MYLCRRLTWSGAFRYPWPPRSSSSRQNRLAEHAPASAWVQAAVTLDRAHPVRTPDGLGRVATMFNALAAVGQERFCGSALPWPTLVCTALPTGGVEAQQTKVRR